MLTYPVYLGAPLTCLLVADGMGGHENGAEASYLAVQSIQTQLADLLDSKETPSEAWCRTLIETAHGQVKSLSAQGGICGTTVTLALVHRTRCSIGHIGDSRAYLVRDGAAKQLTVDHTWEEEARRRGVANTGGAALMQAVGVGTALEVETQTVELTSTDALVLCSDGLHKLVSADQIEKSTHAGSARETCDVLLGSAIDAGGDDNVTVCVLQGAHRHPASSRLTKKANRGSIAVWAALFCVVLLMGGIGALIAGRRAKGPGAPPIKVDKPKAAAVHSNLVTVSATAPLTLRLTMKNRSVQATADRPLAFEVKSNADKSARKNVSATPNLTSFAADIKATSLMVTEAGADTVRFEVVGDTVPVYIDGRPLRTSQKIGDLEIGALYRSKSDKVRVSWYEDAATKKVAQFYVQGGAK